MNKHYELPSVRLRALEPEDLDELYTIENDVDLWNVGATNVPYSKYALHNYIASSSSDIYTDRQVRLIIENQKRDIVGIIDVFNFDPTHRRAEIGILVKNQYRKKGYAQAALDKIICYSREIIHIHQLYAYVGEDNIESKKSFLTAGFVTSTMLQDWLFDGHDYKNAVLMQLFL